MIDEVRMRRSPYHAARWQQSCRGQRGRGASGVREIGVFKRCVIYGYIYRDTHINVSLVYRTVHRVCVRARASNRRSLGLFLSLPITR